VKIQIAGWIALVGLATGMAQAGDIKVKLSGSEEVPPVTTSATGEGTITINDDKTVSGSITTKGVEGIAAHIHVAERGKNGPPIITLQKQGDDTWVVPAGAKLTDEQYAALEAGHLYVNVHSATNKPGEIRGQLQL
jgi:hypothetical protein